MIGGDFIFFPVTQHALHSAARLLETDRTSLPAPLRARLWGAFFRGETANRTDLYYRADADRAAVVLWDSTGVEVARALGPGLLPLSVPPGAYDLGLDADSAGVRGRLRGSVAVPRFSGEALALSSLVLAPGDSVADRLATLAAMPANLVYPQGRSLVAYAEVYGLARDTLGMSRYVVRYTFAPVRPLLARLLRASEPVVLEFTRETPLRDRVAERLVIAPGRVPPGRYRLTLGVMDALRHVRSESVTVELVIR
jgi:hypothetical protein